MDGRYSARAVRRRRRRGLGVARRARRRRRDVEGPCFIDEGAVVKAGARIGPYSVIGRQCHIEEHAIVDGSIVWAEQPDQPGGGRPRIDPRPPLPHRPQRRRRGRRRARRQDPSSPTTAGSSDSTSMTINPTSSKPTTSAALYPDGSQRRGGAGHRRGVRRLSRRRSGSPSARDMRLSSPSLAAAFIDGATLAGRRRRRLRHDGDRHAVLRRRDATGTTAACRSPRRTTPSSTTA